MKSATLLVRKASKFLQYQKVFAFNKSTTELVFSASEVRLVKIFLSFLNFI